MTRKSAHQSVSPDESSATLQATEVSVREAFAARGEGSDFKRVNHAQGAAFDEWLGALIAERIAVALDLAASSLDRAIDCDDDFPSRVDERRQDAASDSAAAYNSGSCDAGNWTVDRLRAAAATLRDEN